MDEVDLSNGYYLTKGIIVTSGTSCVDKIVPIWDSRITYEDNEFYGPSYKLDGKRESGLIDVLFNVNTKELSLGVEINFYDVSSNNFSVGDIVYVNVKNTIYKSCIKEVIYADYKVSIYRYKDLEQWLINRINKEHPRVQFTLDGLYCIKNWIPYFVLEDGRLIKWEHELFKEFVSK